mmetsp:Transcript_3524/g.3471  ORF Transcript_3524/g.3471 Transcript_3524/m.3471 type:complete len:170 (+) Transcript_3524:72-581(+)
MLIAWVVNQFRRICVTDIKTEARRPLMGRMISGAIVNIFYMTSVRLTTLSKALTIYFANPMFIALFGYLLNGEELTRYDYICIICCFLGVLVTLNPFMNHSDVPEEDVEVYQSKYLDYLGQICALIASVLCGLTMTFMRRLSGKVDPVTNMFYWALGSSIVAPAFWLAN